MQHRFVQRSVGAIPAFGVLTERPTLAVSLRFRCGSLDEPARQHGWTHLVEHLTLDGIDPRVAVNGSTQPLFTTFELAGSPDLVMEALARVLRFLTDLPFPDLDAERRVLAAESEWRASSAGRTALLWRFGCAGPGMLAFNDLALTFATPAELTTFARERFTAGNAAIVFSGSWPDDAGCAPADAAALCLPPGSPRPAPELPRSLVTGPSWYRADPGGLLVSQTMPHTPAARIYSEVLDPALSRHCRRAWWMTSAPDSDLTRMSANESVLLAHVPLSQRTRTLQPGLDEHFPLAADRVADLLPRVHTRYRAAATDEPWTYAYAAEAAQTHLLGGTVPSPEDHLDSFLAVTAEDVEAVARTAWPTTLIGGNPDLRPETYQLITSARRAHPHGRVRRFRPKGWPAVSWTLELTDTSLAYSDEPDHAFPLNAIALRLHRPDGQRVLIDQEGWMFTVEPALMRRHKRLIAALDALPVTHGTFALPGRTQPPTPPTFGRSLQLAGHRLAGALCRGKEER